MPSESEAYRVVHDRYGKPAQVLQVESTRPRVLGYFRRSYSGPIVVNGGYDLLRADAALHAGVADAVAFGTPYLANPDLVERLRDGLPLAPVPPKEVWYGGGEAGYTDFPSASRRAVHNGDHPMADGEMAR